MRKYPVLHAALHPRIAAALLCLALSSGGCSYLRYTGVQNRYEAMHADSPSQWLAKHLLGKDSYFVYGRLVDRSAAGAGHPIAVAALSSRYRQDEIVEVHRLGGTGSYYGMNLPEGEYRLLVLADLDGSGAFEPGEVVGERNVAMNRAVFPDKVAGDLDIALVAPRERGEPVRGLPIDVPAARETTESLYFPHGTIRTLDDPIFSVEVGQMGIYDPAAFVETAPMMFYALEEDAGYKVPVIFVHGIGGSPAQFSPIVERLDRRRCKPWFFHYPGGEDLGQLARLFHDIFLSGRMIPDEGAPLVLVAHSMGGLVVREAMNLQGRNGAENRVALIVTMATPFGGDPDAAKGVARAPIVPRSWRDLDPAGPFIARLFRTPLPSATAHHLIYAFRDKDDIARGSDGVVALSRQLPAPALAQAARKQGFRSEHTALLSDPAAIDYVIGLVEQVKSDFPEEHLRLLQAGGFDVPLNEAYSAREMHAIHVYGLYLRAVANGELAPIHPEQRRFIEVANGKAAPSNDFESAWRKFSADYPELAKADAR
jgi:pimeloyl-ACP methyl ester carboxylesterase